MDDEFSYFNIVLLLIPLGIFIYFFINYYNSAQLKLANSQKDKHKRKIDKSAQPMSSIFFKYNHSSVEAWLAWITNQGKLVKEAAYEKLRVYLLDSSANQLGALVSEVIVAILKFGNPKSFDHIKEFIERVNRNHNHYSNLESFYDLALVGLAELDPAKSFDFLKEEFNLVKRTDGLDQIRTSIISAMAGIESDLKLIDFWSELFLDAQLIFKHKSEAFRYLSQRDIKFRSDLYSKVLSLLINSNKEDPKLVQMILTENKTFVNADHVQVWDLALNTLKKAELYKDLLEKFILNQVLDLSVNLEAQNLEPLLEFDEPLRSKFCNALAQRFQLSDDELSLTKKTIHSHHLVFKKGMIVIEKSKKTKPINSELERHYSYFEDNMVVQEGHSEPFLFKSKKPKNKVIVPVLCGDDELVKQYTIRAIAANNRINFIYSDTFELVDSNKILVFQGNVSANKPVIVYLDNFAALFEQDLNDAQAKNLKELAKLISVLAILPDITFMVSASSDDSTFISSDSFKKQFNAQSIFDMEYMATINKPTGLQQKVILDDCIEIVKSTRLNQDFNAETLLSEFNGQSLIDYVNYLGAFFEKSLLLEGELSLGAFYRYVGPSFSTSY